MRGLRWVVNSEMTGKAGTIRIPPRGTRGSGMPGGALLMRVFRPVVHLQTSRLKNASGPEPKTFMGFPVVLLTTIGAKTGKERTNALGGFSGGEGAWLVVASNGGSARHPAWFINLAKNPDKVWLQVGNRKQRVNIESLQGADRDAAYARVAAATPNYARYPEKTDREIPVLRLTPAQ
jgi:deazaflavin-dependent oxidoreductase (nitroreductase family)